MADTTKILSMCEGTPNAIEPLNVVLEDMISNYNSRQMRLWEMRFAMDVIKSVAEERAEDFGELYGSIENALLSKGKRVFQGIAEAVEDSESLEAVGIDKFMAVQIADKAAEKMPPESQRGGKQIPDGSYVEFEAVAYSDSRNASKWVPFGTKLRYKTRVGEKEGELSLWDSESGAYKIIDKKPFFVGNLLPIEIEGNDDSIFVYYTARIAIAQLPEQPSEETSAYEHRPASERTPTKADLEAADMFASLGAESGTASPEQVSAVLEKMMAGQGGNGTNGDVKKPKRLDAADSRRLMRVHNNEGGSAYAPQ